MLVEHAWNNAAPMSGQLAVTAVAQPLIGVTPSPNQLLKQSVTVEALKANTASVFIGNSTVTTSTGFELPAGAQVTLNVADPSKIYAIAAAGGQTISFIGI